MYSVQPYYLQDIVQRGKRLKRVYRSERKKQKHLDRGKTWKGFRGARRKRSTARNWDPERKKERVTKAEGEHCTNFVACLCHQHPVGTTDVQMMSCRKGIGWEGGAREDRRQAEPWSERGREGERDQDCGSPSLPCSHAIIPFSKDMTQYSLESVSAFQKQPLMLLNSNFAERVCRNSNHFRKRPVHLPCRCHFALEEQQMCSTGGFSCRTSHKAQPLQAAQAIWAIIYLVQSLLKFTLPSPDQPQHKNPIVLVVCSDNGFLWSSREKKVRKRTGLKRGESRAMRYSNLYCWLLKI